MRATKPEAMRMIDELVKLAKGNSYLVYKAIIESNGIDEIKQYIKRYQMKNETNTEPDERLLDILFRMAAIIEQKVIDNPFVQSHPKIKKDAEKISKLINKLYQDIGAVE